jgi:hypothetical protein
MLIIDLAYWGRNFSYVFWENEKSQKALSKLTDLKLYFFQNIEFVFTDFSSMACVEQKKIVLMAMI